jgi:hypothetical protein
VITSTRGRRRHLRLVRYARTWLGSTGKGLWKVQIDSDPAARITAPRKNLEVSVACPWALTAMATLIEDGANVMQTV